MAKAAGKLNQTPSQPGRRLGIKIYGGQKTNKGAIIVRQNGSIFHPGDGVKMGKDYTIFSVKEGIVNFRHLNGKQIVEVR